MDHGASDILRLLTTQLQGLDGWDLWDLWDPKKAYEINRWSPKIWGRKDTKTISGLIQYLIILDLICCFYNSMDSRMSTDLLIWLLIVSK